MIDEEYNMALKLDLYEIGLNDFSFVYLCNRSVENLFLYLIVREIEEGFAKPGILFNIKVLVTSEPQYFDHIRGFRCRENAAIGQKNGFAKPYRNIS
ncbi:MAG TPA: hypothetical protein VKA34_12190 [Balneolales bacterium]|nr:hypothetical protein [Balneolales bacterium]